MHVVITRPIPEAAPLALRAAGHEVAISQHDRPLAPSELLAVSEKADGLITMLTDRIDEPFLAARPNIKAIANYAVGYNNIDVPACTRRRIGVSNTPDILTDATAEMAWALLFAAARRAGEAERFLRKGGWDGWGPLQFLGMAVFGRTLGIIGGGRIGARTAEMSRGFDMTILYANRQPNTRMAALGASFVPLDELLKASDFVSIHVALTPETRHLIGARELALMKPTAVLVNTARGPVVDEAALADALKCRQIFAAGIDVFEEEPRIHPGLLELENAVLVPHIGSATVTARADLADLAAKNLIAMLAGKRPPTPLNPELWS